MSEILSWISDAKQKHGVFAIRLDYSHAWALCRELSLLQMRQTEPGELFSLGKAQVYDVEITWPVYKNTFDAYVDAAEKGRKP